MKGTGTLRRWAFEKIDWDEVIKDGRLEVTEMDLDLLNETELVEILQLLGVPVDRGYGHAELCGMLRRLGRGEVVEAQTTINLLRDRLIMLWDRYSHTIHDQVPPYCEFRCYEHPDLMVLSCYILNKGQINKELKK